MGLALFTKASGTLSIQSAFSRGSWTPGQENEPRGPLCSSGSAWKRERQRKQDPGTKALMEQRCFNQHGVGIYTVVILSKDKDYNPRLTKHRWSISKRERVVNNHFYHMVHKKEEGSYHCIEKWRKCLDSSAPGRDLPLLLILEYLGINKEQTIPDTSKTVHRKPPVKCLLTIY